MKTDHPSGRNVRLWFIMGGIVLLVALGISEVALRATGHGPWTNLSADVDEPTMHASDPTLGWRNRPGHYVYPARGRPQQEIEITFLADGRRASEPAAVSAARTDADRDPRRPFVLIGGSFTQGWGISDTQTYGWLLQEAFPPLAIQNYGTGGFGTYQSLLMLEDVLADTQPAAVVYGFIEHHEERNVAPAGWLKLLSQFSRRGHVDVPYCTLDDSGELERHPPERYPDWPLRGQLATVNFALEQTMIRRTRDRAGQKEAVTERLLVEMDHLCRSRSVPFAVVFLSGFRPKVKERYLAFLREQGIQYLDCGFPLTPEFRVPVEGHPNARAHARWAECVGEAIRRYITS